jgi:glycosyltransferase involved in cell wall biosynthesis
MEKVKKIILLSSAESVHTTRWANSLAQSGLKIYLVSQHDLKDDLGENVRFFRLPFSGPAGYFANVFYFRKLVKKLQPDLIHAHFASGYGTLARLSGFEYFLSVWGADVYDFPDTLLKKNLLKKNLNSAKKLFSTSYCMKGETEKYTDKAITVIPFGVDPAAFFVDSARGCDVINFAIVKVIDYKYGIDVLLEAFAIVLAANTGRSVRLNIAGDGPTKVEMENLVQSLGISDDVKFHGRIPNSMVPEFLSGQDIFVVSSRLDSESFGVVAVEAGAAKLPCVVTNVGGLPEVVIDNVTGIVVPKEDPVAMASAMQILIDDAELRVSLGENARERVMSEYVWDENVLQMVSHYREAFDEN